MNTELEKNQSEQNTDQQMNSREGYGRPQGNYQREYNSSNELVHALLIAVNK